ncbi:hypothetical protein SAMN05216388_100922 [Halorientalis persicus]|uniref:Uncharacterized protein n=1 Tax=Halorientalis persicus TaxID=1367881 RepID=A0A1H8MJX5_9EURY|nr:hypothetical protein SAMN05216388_100922 [Halorientalis persicus]
MFDTLASCLETEDEQPDEIEYTPSQRERNVPTQALLAERTGPKPPYCRPDDSDVSTKPSSVRLWHSLVATIQDRLSLGISSSGSN